MGFYIDPNGISELRLQSVVREMSYGSKQSVVHAGPIGWAWIDDDPDRFGPALDERTGITVISSGRLVWSAQEWSRAASLPFSGGLANRLILDRFLSSGGSGVTPYNGAASIIIIDPREEKLHLWTDQFGYHPCFLYRGDTASKCIITTFPDALVVDPSAELTWDLPSMAEFLRAWRTTPPHTYFTEVKHAGAASHITVEKREDKVARALYWRPFEDEFYPSINAAAEDLAFSVREAIVERTAIAKRPLFFVSGGADSRVLLFNAADRGNVTAVNLYERAAKETEVARDLCISAGCEFKAIQRDNDFYPRNLPGSVRWSGAMWSAEDTHYSGFAEEISDLAPDLVMTACTTDWLFKGYGLEKKHVSLFGKSLPLMRYIDKRAEGFLPNVPLPAPVQFSAVIEERMNAWFQGCPDVVSSPRDRLLIEDRRVRPTAYTVSVSGSIMYRNFPFDTFLADSRVADCYSRIHPDWKLNREVWGKAAARLTGNAGKIVDANFGWSLEASKGEKMVAFTRGWIGRRLKTRSNKREDSDFRPPSSGSWPELGWYALHSPTLKELWESVTLEERERMSAICLVDPWEKSLADWSSDGNYLFRIVTLLTFWRETELRRGRVVTN